MQPNPTAMVLVCLWYRFYVESTVPAQTITIFPEWVETCWWHHQHHHDSLVFRAEDSPPSVSSSRACNGFKLLNWPKIKRNLRAQVCCLFTWFDPHLYRLQLYTMSQTMELWKKIFSRYIFALHGISMLCYIIITARVHIVQYAKFSRK